jgi:hypothetical protein
MEFAFFIFIMPGKTFHTALTTPRLAVATNSAEEQCEKWQEKCKPTRKGSLTVKAQLEASFKLHIYYFWNVNPDR